MASEELSIKSIMEELKGNNWQNYQAYRENSQEINQLYLCQPDTKIFTETLPFRHSQIPKRVAIDCVFTSLRYDKLLLKNAMNNKLDKDEEVIQVNTST